MPDDTREFRMRRFNLFQRMVSTILCTAIALALTFAQPSARADEPAKSAANITIAWQLDDAAHLLRRAGFSGTPAQITRLHAMGREAAVEYLITGAVPEKRQPVFDAVKLDEMEIPPEKELPEATTKPNKDAAKNAERKRQIESLRIQWINRMIHTDRPLDEKMVLFWHGLFTSGIQEVKVPAALLQQHQLFRQHATGNYAELAHAIVRDPAMLRYLDNNANTKGKPNENLARELCELFTMGEGRGYTEKDIAEIARALTGATTRGDKETMIEYHFQARQHDTGAKTIFGKTGNFNPDDVVTLILERDEPAQFLAERLWTYFVYPNPTPQDLAPITAILREKKYEIAPALRAILNSPAFYSDRAKFACIKSPIELVVSTIRILELPVSNPNQMQVLASASSEMGQQLFQPPNVRGWPGGESWITAATLFDRYNIVSDLVDGRIRSAKRPGSAKSAVPIKELFPNLPAEVTPAQLVAAAVDRFLQRPLHPEKIKVLANALGAEPIKLNDPASEKHIRTMIALLLSTPEYQVQ